MRFQLNRKLEIANFYTEVVMSKRIFMLTSLVVAAAIWIAVYSAGEDDGKTPPAAPPKETPKTTAKTQKQAVRSLGVKVGERGNAETGLSDNAKAFYAELAKVTKDKKAPTDLAPVWGEKGDAAGYVGAVSARGGGRMATNMAPPSMPSAPPPMMAPKPQAAAEFSMRAAAGASAKAADSAKLGVTTGGMKDIGQMRQMIEQGKIPAPEMVQVEALLSEHDIPLDGEKTGESELYGSASVAWAKRYGKARPEAVVQIGFGIDWKANEFKRKPLNLAVVQDVSGSMNGAKIEATRKALNTLVDKLDEKDRLAIVLFNHQAWVLVESAPVKDKKAIHDKIATIQANGSTSIESGLRAGFHQVAAHLDESEKSARVFLLTDEQPNVGTTAAYGFKPMMEGAAAAGIGLSGFGVGIDFGQALAYEMFQVRGANYFFLENAEKIAKVFDEEFDYMVTPLAYDVVIDLKPAAGAKVTDVMGVPDFKQAGDKVQMKIPSLFLSKRQGGGATLVAMEINAPELSEEAKIAEIELSFTRVGEMKKITQSLAAYLTGGDFDPEAKKPFYSQPGAKKALLLADAAVAMKAACRGQKGPTQGDLYWTVHPPAPMPMPAVKAIDAVGEKAGRPVPAPPVGPPPILPPHNGEEGYYPYTVTINKEQAAEAVKGLGGFGDWFATQIADVQGAEKELRLMEKLENNLRTLAGMPAREARKIPAVAQPDTSAPNPDIF
jgi:Ca-activated chloride channel homolog